MKTGLGMIISALFFLMLRPEEPALSEVEGTAELFDEFAYLNFYGVTAHI